MAGVRLSVAPGDAAGLAPERLCDAAGHDDASERQVAARDALCKGDEVRLDPEALIAEPRSESSETADDRVADEEHARVAADLGGAFHVVLGRRHDAAGADHRLDEEGGHLFRADPLDLVGERVR